MIFLVLKAEISNVQLASVAAKGGLCLTWSKTPKTGFLTKPHNAFSRVMRKPAFCICENKGADQRCGNRAADQHLCFPYIDSTIFLLLESENFESLVFCGCTAGLCRPGRKP